MSDSADNSYIDGPQIRLHKSIYSFGIDVLIRQIQPNGLMSVAKTITLETVDANYQINPTMNIDNTAAQILMDDLWNCGIRPSEGSGSAGQLAAVERHLADMRTIAYEGLKIKTE